MIDQLCAVLVAVTLNRGATGLVSADRAFATVPHRQWIDPAMPALDRILGP